MPGVLSWVGYPPRMKAENEGRVIHAVARLMASYYAGNMTLVRHYSDTRTEVGRVRFLLTDHGAQLMAEGPGWRHISEHGSLQEAAQMLAFLPEVPQQLYEQSLHDLHRRQSLEQAA